MERESIAALLERYWQAETTVEEEKTLAAYFRGGNDIPPEWEPYRGIFSFFAEEAEVRAGQDLEEKILEHIRPLPAVGPARTRLRFAWWAAAAVIILVAGLVPLLQPAPEPAVPSVAQYASRTLNDASIKDTYDDPQQALAAVQRALFKASVKMNKGLHPLK
ncbi:hypothetical protein Q4E93_07890 [Flavitalea sp. BT771]|uniref:hypothetical protein n=1 Tax=Flavitalea sp. BT771 TaxID=3063329 RepID=UPI0026E2AE66|nr:hypothetical protein [Flavitalea sp. BT771]MDO6430502.1 hypothetical protein [Flavitalea sp. BT771]MDV6219358.1 hypothetical protein [Flavitalea sp. BT771]